MNPSVLTLRPSGRHREAGIAIILVLAFIVILTALVFAFFSRALTERQVANSSLNQSKADILAHSAVDVIVGDFKQEIVAGSALTPSGYTLYVPTSNLYMLPESSGTPSPSSSNSPYPVPNLVRRSVRADPLASPSPALPLIQAVTTSASAVNSTTDATTNGRSVSLARWNSHYLIPRRVPTSTTIDSTPISPQNPTPLTASDPSGFTAPDWVMVTTTGPKVLTAPDTTTIGRYAYAIYDEGGLLDVNVAGFPSQATAAQAASKISLSFADLSTLPYAIPKTPAGTSQVDQIVGWRNYASISQPPSNLSPAPPAATPSGAFPNYNVSAQNASNFWLAAFGSTTGSLNVSSTTYPSPTPASGGVIRTDQAFTTRQSLLGFRRTTTISQNALQYLSTFSRGLNQPSYVPAVHASASAPTVLAASGGGNSATGLDKEINPNYLTVRVQKSFTRTDGSRAAVGDPLVSKRFPLQRLAWLTYKGPSKGRPATDPDIQALIQNGVPYPYLQLGDDAHIADSFGLKWDATKSRWLYNVHNNSVAVGKGSIMRLGRNPAIDPTADPTKYVQDLAIAREPDFFELLKSAINVGTLGKPLTKSATTATVGSGSISAATIPANYRYNHDVSVDYQVIQIGANIIDQFDLDGFPTRISFDDGAAGPNEFAGVESLPYLNYVFDGVIETQAAGTPSTPPSGTFTSDPAILATDPTNGNLGSKPGVGVQIMIPGLWNPHDPNGTLPPPALRPAKLRIVADSTDPDHLGSYATYDQYYVIGSGNGRNLATAAASPAPAGQLSDPELSYNADSNSPSGVGFGSPSSRTKQILSDQDTALTFNDTDSSGKLQFIEPTLLLRPGGPINLANAGSRLLGDFPSGSIPSFAPNPLGFGNASNTWSGDPANSSFLGIYVGAYPLRWYKTDTAAPPSKWTVTANSATIYRYINGAGNDYPGALYLTYRVQYQDPANASNWITYDTKYVPHSFTNRSVFYYLTSPLRGNNQANGDPAKYVTLLGGNNGNGPGIYASWASAVDPRSARFGMFYGRGIFGPTSSTASMPATPEWNEKWDSSTNMGSDSWKYSHGWIDPANGVLLTARPDRDAGYHFYGAGNGSGLQTFSDAPIIVKTPETPSNIVDWMAPLDQFFSSYFSRVAPGLLTQNNTDIQFILGRYTGDGNNSGRDTSLPGAGPYAPTYYADADGVVRRAMGGYVPASTNPGVPPWGAPTKYSSDMTTGLPMARILDYAAYPPGNPQAAPANTDPATPTAALPGQKWLQTDQTFRINQAQSRPLMLNRPFRSVAELGYVFRDTPWKNLDFFTPESGDVALLDVFCVQDTDNSTGLVAGKINLNTKQSSVLTAIIAGAYVDDPKVTNTTIGTLAPTAASTIAGALVQRTQDPNYVADNTGPLRNISELVGKWVANKPITPVNGAQVLNATDYKDGKNSYAGFSGIYVSGATAAASPAMDLTSAYQTISWSGTNATNAAMKQSVNQVQRFHEAPIRALSSVGQTRVWNLMIDVIAQTGRYPTNAAQATSPLAAFLVEGEQRYWVHVAIDRYTGQVLDKQIEVVKE